MKTSLGAGSFCVLLSVLIAAGVGCGAGSTPAITWSKLFTADQSSYRDAEHWEVVHLSTGCSGTLIGPRHVLTAAHCVAPPFLPSVHVDPYGELPSGDFQVIRCHMHPGAYGRPLACGDAPDPRDLVRGHDLALLELHGPVPRAVSRTIPVLLGADDDPSYWVDRPVELVGWNREPLSLGVARRYAGWNHITELDHGVLTTRPRVPPPLAFTTRTGNSGGPALARLGSRVWVVGVLSGGSGHRQEETPFSVYASTFHPDNARWLRRIAPLRDVDP